MQNTQKGYSGDAGKEQKQKKRKKENNKSIEKVSSRRSEFTGFKDPLTFLQERLGPIFQAWNFSPVS